MKNCVNVCFGLLFVGWILILETNGSERWLPIRRKSKFKFPDIPEEEISGKCKTRSGRIGKCIKYAECRTWRDQIRVRPCNWIGEIPFVCCNDYEDVYDGSEVGVPNVPVVANMRYCGIRPMRIINSTAPSSLHTWEVIDSRREKRQLSIAEGYADSDHDTGNFNVFVVGGEEAEMYTWPWMAAVMRNVNRRSRFICGATLISDNYLLSAAHCFGENGNPNPLEYSILLGTHTTSGEADSYAIQGIKLHEEYRNGEYYHDIAVIRLREHRPLESHISPICLPSPNMDSNSISAGRSVTVTGWGSTFYGGVSSKGLMEASIPIVSISECRRSYSNSFLTNLPRGITEDFICAGLPQGGRDACQGDSGGPLMLEDNTSTWMLVGVVSFGFGCGEASHPGVYTNVMQHLDWVIDNSDVNNNEDVTGR